MISVTIHKPGVALGAQWDDLVSRAQPNVFMDPAALKAAADTMFAVIHVLLAWELGLDEPKLIGLWALQERRAFPFWPKILEALPYEYAFLSNPVVDHAYVTQVIPAFLAAIGEAPALPKVVALRSLDGEAATCAALVGGLTARGGRSVTLKSESRPCVTRQGFAKQTGERAKKLRQNWKKLSALGTVEVLHFTEPAAVSAGLEALLALEYQSWKGPAGTALLCRDTDAAFARRLFADLAARGEAAIHLLELNGQAIAAQAILFCGSVAYTWKTGFDEAFARFSPGVVLIDRCVDDILAMPRIAAIDSCSTEASFMAKICNGRRTTHDILIDVGPRRSIAFGLETLRWSGRERLKRLRDRAQAALAAHRAGRRVPVSEPVEKAPSLMNRTEGQRHAITESTIRSAEPSPSIAAHHEMPDTPPARAGSRESDTIRSGGV